MAIPTNALQIHEGLRERKKAKTRAAIQEHAMRLFKKKGYHSTSIEEIAESADISTSTFFRYFPNKQAVVMHDSLDPLLIEMLRSQPRDISVIQALRRSIKKAFTELPPGRFDKEMERFEFIRSVPELRANMLNEYVRNIDLFSMIISERAGLKKDEYSARILAGAIVGALMSVSQNHEKMPTAAELPKQYDKALAVLEKVLNI